MACHLQTGRSKIYKTCNVWPSLSHKTWMPCRILLRNNICRENQTCSNRSTLVLKITSQTPTVPFHWWYSTREWTNSYTHNVWHHTLLRSLSCCALLCSVHENNARSNVICHAFSPFLSKALPWEMNTSNGHKMHRGLSQQDYLSAWQTN